MSLSSGAGNSLDIIINHESVKGDRRISLRVFIEVGKDSVSMSESYSESPRCQAEERGARGLGFEGSSATGRGVGRKRRSGAGSRSAVWPKPYAGERMGVTAGATTGVTAGTTAGVTAGDMMGVMTGVTAGATTGEMVPPMAPSGESEARETCTLFRFEADKYIGPVGREQGATAEASGQKLETRSQGPRGKSQEPKFVPGQGIRNLRDVILAGTGRIRPRGHGSP